VQKSSIHGFGLFTTQDLYAGQLIWALHKNFDVVVDLANYDKLSPHNQEYLQTYMYWSRAKNCYILCLDNARYMNHSDNSNTETVFLESMNNISDLIDISEGFTVASRDIKSGEELSCNYNKDFPDYGPLRTQDFL
jgi:SET domain-containing protein